MCKISIYPHDFMHKKKTRDATKVSPNIWQEKKMNLPQKAPPFRGANFEEKNVLRKKMLPKYTTMGFPTWNFHGLRGDFSPYIGGLIFSRALGVQGSRKYFSIIPGYPYRSPNVTGYRFFSRKFFWRWATDNSVALPKRSRHSCRALT